MVGGRLVGGFKKPLPPAQKKKKKKKISDLQTQQTILKKEASNNRQRPELTRIATSNLLKRKTFFYVARDFASVQQI